MVHYRELIAEIKRISKMLKNSIIEAVESETGNKDLAFKVYNLIKFQRFTELIDEDEFNTLIMERDLR